MGTTGNNERHRSYSASKLRPEGKSSWVLMFRHPLRKDSRGKQGLKIRRGLGSDESEADRLVEQMNQLLSSEEWWSLSRRAEAEKKFSPIVTSAFYDAIDEPRLDSGRIRDQEIPLPSREEGYTTVLFVGSTGAGKTTLLRHLIGTHPYDERFPSTSTAKTTISDIEIITGGQVFRAVVTFFSGAATRTAIHECVLDACTTSLNGASEEEIADRLLNHRDQKFRFSYTLGQWNSDGGAPPDEDWDFGDQLNASSASEERDAALLKSEDIKQAECFLESLVSRVKSLANRVRLELEADLSVSVAGLEGQKRDDAVSRFEEKVEAETEFDDITADYFEAVASRFDSVRQGTFSKRRSGWPEKWVYTCHDRDDFIRSVKQFSSNSASAFGRLLTPLVDGIRVKGPFRPPFATQDAHLVLIDGQGLGHIPDISVSVSTRVTERFEEVDLILLVDNAEVPIQATPLSVLRVVANSGYEGKVALAFTHFDQVKGANLPGYKEKRNHVLASLHNGLAALRTAIGQSTVNALERKLHDRTFFLGAIDQPLQALPKGPRLELERLLSLFQEVIQPVVPPPAVPIYDTAGVLFAVRTAADDFHRVWNARLGFRWVDGFDKVHWSKVRALARRLALQIDVEYDVLKPLSDLIIRLQEGISKFLNEPMSWDPAPVTPEEAAERLSAVRREVFKALHALAHSRLAQDHLQDWVAAFEESGVGSAARRATKIRLIYEDAAPVPGEAITPVSSEFLKIIRQIVRQAIEAGGGRVTSA